MSTDKKDNYLEVIISGNILWRGNAVLHFISCLCFDFWLHLFLDLSIFPSSSCFNFLPDSCWSRKWTYHIDDLISICMEYYLSIYQLFFLQLYLYDGRNRILLIYGFENHEQNTHILIQAINKQCDAIERQNN